MLKNDYKDVPVVFLNSSTVFEFSLSDNGISVTQNDDVDLITLRSNVNFGKAVHYNDNIEVKSGSLRYTSGRGILQSDKICGDYELDDIFYTDAKMCLYMSEILYEASEVSFKAKRVYKDPKYLTKVFFHEESPTALRKLTFKVDTAIRIDMVEMNFEGFDIEKEVTEEEGKNVYTFTVEGIDELKGEGHSLGYLHHYPHLVVVTRGYQTAAGNETVIASLDDLYDWYSGLVNAVEVDKSVFAGKVNELISGASCAEDKIRRIYYWVQENIKYLAFEDGIAGFKPDSPQNVFKKRYGDCKGMAMLTKYMLEEAGIDARLTWIGTNKIPYTYDLPSLAVDNHMICTAFLNDNLYILDATEKFIALGKHAERIQGKEMLIENGDNYIRKVVPRGTAGENLILRTEHLELIDQNLVGKGKLVVDGEAKKTLLYFSENSRVEDTEELFGYLSVSEHSNQDEVKVENIPETNRDEPLELEYTYSLGNKVSSFGQEIYVEIDWDKPFAESIIDDGRVTDYYFGRKVKNALEKRMKIPAGYNVTHLPAPIDEQYEDVSLKVDFTTENGYVSYSSEFIIESGRIKKEDFDNWNKIIEKLDELYSDQIVLTKI